MPTVRTSLTVATTELALQPVAGATISWMIGNARNTHQQF
jgi:hypothetical protein